MQRQQSPVPADHKKTKAQLLDELADLRQRLCEFEKSASSHVQVEPGLGAGKNLHQFMVEHSLGLMCIHDFDGTIIYMNPASAHSLGCGPQGGIGKNVKDFLAPSAKPLFDAYLSQIRQQPAASGVMRVQNKSGGERIWSYRNIQYEEAGKPLFVIGHAQDITDYMRMESAFKESEEQLRILIEDSNQGMLLHQEGEILTLNRAALRMFGYDNPDELIGQQFRTVLAPHEYTRLREYRIKRMQGEPAPPHYEAEGRRKDGSAVWMECLPSVVPWQGGRAVMMTFIDISMRKQAEEQVARMLTQLEQSHDDMLSILNQLQLGIAMTDAEGRITFLSQNCQGLLGGEAQNILGQGWETICPFDAASKSELKAMADKPETERGKVSAHVALPNGQRYWLEVDVKDDPCDAKRKIFVMYDIPEVHDLRRLLSQRAKFHDLIGRSKPMRQVFQQIRDLAKVDTTVLIQGETGTGKELVARAIHRASPRKDGPFITVNCAGLTETLTGSQLFGHRRGAFTGAVSDQDGLFEAANGGTIFLDEIGDIPFNTQVSLLRVLQEREITRLGESRPRKVDVRVLSATHHNLQKDVAEGRFRSDLMYRLRVAWIDMPPLRERREDIPLLVHALLNQCRTERLASQCRR